jgi:hypothetical protein
MTIDKRGKVHRCGCKACAEHPYSRVAKEHRAINNLLTAMNEKDRRHCVGLLAFERGDGGVTALHDITGMSRVTIRRGLGEVMRQDRVNGTRLAGGGRKAVEKNSPAF